MNNGTSRQPKPKRVRRSTEEIIDRLMEAAVEEFEEKGYSGATTAAIARRAKVAEALLFNHFGSKAQLFQDTIFQPLSAHFDRFLSDHPVDPADPGRRRVDSLEYIAELQDFIASHPRMLLSLVFAQCYKSSDIDGLAQVQGLHDYFDRSASLAKAKFEEEPKFDPELMARISFVSIMSCILFQDWIFPESIADPAKIRDTISHFVMDGMNANKPES